MKYVSVKNFEQFQHYKDRSPPWIKLYNELLEDYEFGGLPDAVKGQLMLIWLLASRMENKLPFDPKWVAQKINATEPVDLEYLMELGWIVPHEASEAKGKREDWPSRYIPNAIKQQVLDRDQNQCVTCEATENLEIDHKIPVSKGGTGEPGNLQVLCRSCNRKKRASLSADAEQVATQMRSQSAQMRSLEREREGETEREKSADAPPSLNGHSASRRFTPPTADEVREYVSGRGSHVNPQKFVDHYTANGWRVGKNPMKDWQAAVRTWEQRDKDDAPPPEQRAWR